MSETYTATASTTIDTSPEAVWHALTEPTMIDARKMTSVGVELVEAAKESGEWEEAYQLADDHEILDELESALRENETTWENFQGYSNTDQHAFIGLVEEAKTAETLEKWIERTVELAQQNLRAYDENNKRRL